MLTAAILKCLKITNAEKHVEKRECSFIIVGNESWCRPVENSMKVPHKTKNRIVI